MNKDEALQRGKVFLIGEALVGEGNEVIRPNLPPKPHTVIVPKVTIKDMEDAQKIFGSAQVAVAKAVADSVEDGIIPDTVVDDWVVVVSVFIHPQADRKSVV